MTFKVRGTGGNVYSQALGPRSPSRQAHQIHHTAPSANPCLAFALRLMEGSVDILCRIEIGVPVDSVLYELDPEELKDTSRVPHSLESSLEVLEKDHGLLETCACLKLNCEIQPLGQGVQSLKGRLLNFPTPDSKNTQSEVKPKLADGSRINLCQVLNLRSD